VSFSNLKRGKLAVWRLNSMLNKNLLSKIYSIFRNTLISGKSPKIKAKSILKDEKPKKVSRKSMKKPKKVKKFKTTKKPETKKIRKKPKQPKSKPPVQKKFVRMPEPWSRVEKYKKVKKNGYYGYY